MSHADLSHSKHVPQDRDKDPRRSLGGMWVLRGGILQADSTLRNRDRVYNAYRIEGICVTAAPDMSVEELAPQIRAFSPLYCHASAEELAAVGCHVIPEPGHEWPDALLVFPDRVTEELLDEVRPLFLRRGTRPNPNDKTGLLQ